MHTNLTLHLTAETEAKLREQAADSGKSPESLAIEALEERLAVKSEAVDIPVDEWEAKLEEWVQSHQSRNPKVDDSRENIYPDRA